MTLETTMATTARTIGILGTALVAMTLGALPAQAQEADPNDKIFRNHQEAVQIRCPNCLHDEERGRSADAPAPRAPVKFKEGSTCPICAGSGFLKTSVDWTAGYYYAEGFGVPSKDMARRYRDADSDKERTQILGKARRESARAAALNAWRNAAKLASLVRLDGSERVGADRVESLSAELVGMENVSGEWNTEHATPFFRLRVKVPLWGVKGVVANLLETARSGASENRKKRPAFDWRKAPAGGGKDDGGKDDGGKDDGGKDDGGKDDGGKDDGGKDDGGKDDGGKDDGGKDDGGNEQVDVPAEKPAEAIKGIIIDARAVKKEKGPVNAALFPAIVTEAAKDAAAEAPGDVKLETVHDVSETDPASAGQKGVMSYVESDTPFERIAAIYGRRGWLVVRAPAESEQLAGLGVFAQVKFGGKKKKQKLTFKVKAKDMEGKQRANIVISAQDARKLKLTDEKTGVLKNCKVIVIAGGDIAGKRGALPADARRTARAR